MSTEQHVAALKAKHEALEQRIHSEENRPQPDEMLLYTLKREKLRIKDEIAGHVH